MRVADQDYVLALHNGAKVVNYATFTFADGRTKTLGPSDFRVSGNTFTDKTTDGNSFSVGSFIGKTVNICIDNTTGEFDDYDFYMSRFILKESIQINSNTLKHVVISEFTVVTDATPGAVIRFSGVDSTYKFDKKHNLTGTKTFKQIVSLACTACLGSSTFDATGNFDLYNTSVDTSKIDANTTWRQIINYVAIAAGYNAYIDPTGLLKFKWYDFSVFDEDGLDGGTFDTDTTPYSDGDTADGGDFTFSESTHYDGGAFTDVEDYHIIQSYKNFQIGTYDISITGVRVINDKTVVESLSPHQYNYSYIIEVKNNPLCEGIESTIASHLAGKLNDFTFRVFSCNVACDPLIEAGDMALVIDTKGVAHKTIINDVQFTTGGFTQIACKAESIIRQQGSYTSEAAKAVVEANKHTDNSLSSYDESVQRMNRLAQNATGLYDGRVKQSDGSYINYVSDHQITYWPDGSARFVQHSFVAKETANGYFYSTDSGTSDLGEYSGSVPTTWTGGLDKNGNAVLHTIAVYKLQADWVIAGILTDKYNYNYLDLDTGEIKIAARAKVYDDQADYSGAYIPTNNNSPASSWNTDALKKAHLGTKFLNTSSKETYVYVNTYPESAHPYGINEDTYYKFTTGISGNINVHLNSSSKTESVSYDYLEFYYLSGSTYYRKVVGGDIGGMDIVIPSGTFWLHWHSDVSVTEWGWKIDSIASTTSSASGFSSASLPSASWTEVNSSYDWRLASLQDYAQVELTQEEVFNVLTNNGAIQGLFMENGQLYVNSSYLGAGTIRVGGSNYSDKAHIEVRDTNDNVTGTWDKDGLTVKNLTATDNSTFGNLQISKKNVQTPVGEQLMSYIYGDGWIEYWYESWEGVLPKSKIGKTAYFSPYYDGWSGNLDINVDFRASDNNYQSSHDTVVLCQVALARWTGTGWSTQKTLKLNYNGDDINGQDLYFTGFTSSDKTLYRLKMSLIRKTWAEDYDIDVYCDSSHVFELNPYEITGSFRGHLEGSASLYSLAVGDFSVGPNGKLAYDDEDTTSSYSVSASGFSSATSSTNYTGISSQNAPSIKAQYDSNNYVEIAASSANVALNIYSSLTRYIKATATQFVARYDSSRYFNISSSMPVLEVYNSDSDYIYLDDTEVTVKSSSNTYAKFRGSASLVASRSGTSYSIPWTTSDRRFKEEIEPLDVELSKNLIDATETKKFKYKDTEGKHYGMIAQEAREVLDSLGETDAVLEHCTDEENEINPRTIDYHEYIPHLINYVKDLRAVVDRQQAEIDELKAELDEVKAELAELKPN